MSNAIVFKVLNAVEIGDGYTWAACVVHKFISINGTHSQFNRVNQFYSAHFVLHLFVFHAIFPPYSVFTPHTHSAFVRHHSSYVAETIPPLFETESAPNANEISLSLKRMMNIRRLGVD